MLRTTKDTVHLLQTLLTGAGIYIPDPQLDQAGTRTHMHTLASSACRILNLCFCNQGVLLPPVRVLNGTWVNKISEGAMQQIARSKSKAQGMQQGKWYKARD